MAEDELFLIGTEQTLNNISESLGFKETEELKQLRSVLTPRTNVTTFIEAKTAYLKLAEDEIDRLNDIDKSLTGRAQIGLIVATAGIYYKMKLAEKFKETIGDAILCSEGLGDEQTANLLQQLLAKSV